MSISITPTYIGLREYLYKPEITRCFVGSAGESVPFPLMAKLKMHWAITQNPIRNSPIPKYWEVEKVEAKVFLKSFPATKKGINPATIPGCTMVKNRFRRKSDIERELTLDDFFIDRAGFGVNFQNIHS